MPDDVRVTLGALKLKDVSAIATAADAIMAVRRQEHLQAINQQPSTSDRGCYFTRVLWRELSKLLEGKSFCSI